MKLQKIGIIALALTLFILNPINTYAEPRISFTLNEENYSLAEVTDSGIFLYSKEGETIPEYIVEAIEKTGISNKMSDVEKADKIAEYLCDVLTYDTATTKFTKKNYIPFTDWCLTTGKAVCAGYADSFQHMCTVLGIECYYEVGHIYEDGKATQYHAWNRIVVDGIDYWYDVCWFDGSNNYQQYIHSELRWNDRKMEEEWFRYRVNGSLYPLAEEN